MNGGRKNINQFCKRYLDKHSVAGLQFTGGGKKSTLEENIEKEEPHIYMMRK